MREIAEGRGIAPAQVALAWVGAQSDRLGVTIVPIPGTRRIHRLEENVAALDIDLSDEELSRLDRLHELVEGDRSLGFRQR